VHPMSIRTSSHARPPPGSSQVVPRHPKAIAYRCFLPDLTGFTDQRCAGPDSQRRTTVVVGERCGPRPGVQLRCSGLRIQGTASSPPSTTGRDGRPLRDDRSIRAGKRGGEGGIRTLDGLPRTAFPVPRHRPLGDLSAVGVWWSAGRPRTGFGGGEGGIRTHGTVTRTPLFESGTFNHSDTSPRRMGVYRTPPPEPKEVIGGELRRRRTRWTGAVPRTRARRR
jgi:hypothetical protein